MGVDVRLIDVLSKHATIPITYAGGVGSMRDMQLIRKTGRGRLDATVGSALDIFGGAGCSYEEVVSFNRQENGV
jgi:phosphoribosylformimino-5-aminoimidazole carboxamide ribotide isomerase